MTIRTWDGATANIGSATDWTPMGALLPGDVGVISTGAVLADSLTLGDLTLLLRGNSINVPATLELTNTTLAANLDIEVRSGHGLSTAPVAQINVNGIDTNAGRIAVGTPLAPASLRIQLAAAQTALVNTGIIEAGSGSTIGIESGQVVNGGRMIVAGGTLQLDTQVTGNGSILIGRDAGGQGGTVVAGQNVGSGQTVLMHGGTLELGSPHFFLGTLKGWDSGSTLELLHTQVTSEDFTGGMLTLHDGIFTEAQIILAGSYTSADFHLLETSDGNTLVTTTHAGLFS